MGVRWTKIAIGVSDLVSHRVAANLVSRLLLLNDGERCPQIIGLLVVVSLLLVFLLEVLVLLLLELVLFCVRCVVGYRCWFSCLFPYSQEMYMFGSGEQNVTPLAGCLFGFVANQWMFGEGASRKNKVARHRFLYANVWFSLHSKAQKSDCQRRHVTNTNIDCVTFQIYGYLIVRLFRTNVWECFQKQTVRPCLDA